MNVPEVYEPKLPKKVAEYVAKKKAAAETSEGQTIWYQCVDTPHYWAKGGHKGCQQEGTRRVEAVLTDPNNEGALMVTFEDNRFLVIENGAMRPANSGQLPVSSNQ